MTSERNDDGLLCDEIDREFPSPEPSPVRVAQAPSTLGRVWLRFEARIGDPALAACLLAGVVCYAIPTLFYGMLRFTGTIDPTLWHSNHGPWRNSWPEHFIIWPLCGMLLLIPFTFCLGLVIALARRSLRDFLRAVAIVGLLCVLTIALYLVTGWTID